MKIPALPAVLVVSLLITCGCTSPTSEAQRLLREREANAKTVEKHGPLTLTGETKTEVYGPRQTSETSASVGFKVSR